MSGWPMVALGEVCEFKGGGTPDKKIAKYWNGDVPWASVKDFKTADICATADTITMAGVENSATRIVQRGTVIVPTRMAVGKAAITQIDLAINQDLKALFPKAEMDERFLLHFLLANEKHLQRHATGATVKGITLDVLRELNIPLPPLVEQKRIAAILDKADDLRRKRRQALALLDTLTQSIFVEMFGDPVTNPMGWPRVAIMDFSNVRLGKMLDKKKMEGLDRYSYLANRNVQWGHFILDDLPKMGFSPNEQDIFKLLNGDLLVCEGGEIGRCAVWRNEQINEIFFQKAVHRIRLDKNRSLPDYLQKVFWFYAKRGGFLKDTAIATIAHLPLVKLRALKVPLPPIKLQSSFVNLIEMLEHKKRRHGEGILASDILFASLQSRAFSGHL